MDYYQQNQIIFQVTRINGKVKEKWIVANQQFNYKLQLNINFDCHQYFVIKIIIILIYRKNTCFVYPKSTYLNKISSYTSTQTECQTQTPRTWNFINNASGPKCCIRMLPKGVQCGTDKGPDKDHRIPVLTPQLPTAYCFVLPTWS